MEIPKITSNTNIKTDRHNHNGSAEPFDKILQTLINSVSAYPGKNRDPKIRNNSQHNEQYDESKNGKRYPNFWPGSLSPSTSPPVPELSLSHHRENVATFDIVSGNGSSGRQRFLSKSANKTGSAVKRNKNRKPHPRTAKPKQTFTSEDVVVDKDWMTILEERSGSKGYESPAILEGHGYGNVIVIDNEDGSSSFSTDFPLRNIFTAGSSDATSIGWADDAMESESTDILSRQWAQVEEVFHGEDDGVIPEGMSDTIYEEVILWRKAFSSKSKRSYNFHRNVNMSQSSAQLTRDCSRGHPDVRDYSSHLDNDFPSPISLLTEFDPRERRLSPNQDFGPQSPSSLRRQTSAFSIQREKFDLDLRLPPSISESSLGGPSTFMQSWLENLTNVGDHDHEPTSSEGHSNFELEIFHNDDDYDYENPSFGVERSLAPSGTLKVKVQRPISSQYLNRSWGKAENVPARRETNRLENGKISKSKSQPTEKKLTLDLDFNVSGDLKNFNSSSSYFDNRRNAGDGSGNNGRNRFLTTSSSNNDLTNNFSDNRTRRSSALWSRHTHQYQDEEEDDLRKDGSHAKGQPILEMPSSTPIPIKKNFLSWLLFDENDENIKLEQNQEYNSLQNS